MIGLVCWSVASSLFNKCNTTEDLGDAGYNNLSKLKKIQLCVKKNCSRLVLDVGHYFLLFLINVIT